MNEDTVKAIVQLIDVCAKRGAFEASEFQTVGALRSQLVESLKPLEVQEEKIEEE